MTMNEAADNAINRVYSTASALQTASEMLDAIKDGKSYGSFEYLYLAQRIREFAGRA